MARKKKVEETAKVEEAVKGSDPIAALGYQPGTVEYAAREHWEREKAAYEERTGEKVTFEPPMPLTKTVISDQSAVDSEQPETEEIEELEEV